ncbi:MAG TPA: hypothetical protein VIL48_02930 [Acidimicrobiales bacterium]
MTDAIVRNVFLAATTATTAILVVESLRRRLAGARLDRQLREQRLS